MGHLLVYYLVILLPLALLLAAVKFHVTSNGWLGASFFLYVLYRQLTDAWRLRSLGFIERVSWKVLLNPFLQTQYFKQLYFTAR